MQLHTWDFYNHCLAEVGFLYYNNILKGKHVNFAIAACLHWLGGHHGFPAIHCMWMHKKKNKWQIYANLWSLDFPSNTIWIIKIIKIIS
jgi:hypothetical protein